MIRIKAIRIKNFKGYQDFRAEFNDQRTIFVGKNDSGKSTVLEAVHLALTGQYHGRPIKQQLTESFFNKNSVEEYFTKMIEQSNPELPEIRIEIFLSGDDEHKLGLLKGNNNLEHSDDYGFAFIIKHDEETEDDYLQFVKNLSDQKNSLPIEFYKIYWETFSREEHYNTRFVPIQSILINADNFKSLNTLLCQFADDILDKNNTNNILNEVRKFLTQFSSSDVFNSINQKLSEVDNLQGVKLSNKELSLDSWMDFISPKDNDISFDFSGDGRKRMVKTVLAKHNIDQGENKIVLLEEPECHLSFSNLFKMMNVLENHDPSHEQMIIATHSSYVANRMDLKNLILLSDFKETTLNKIRDETATFFKRRANYDTLRPILSNLSVIVEGDSDDLIFEKAYKQKYKKLPIEDGIDVITVALTYKNYLEIARTLGLKMIVITDNDGHLERVKENVAEYLSDTVFVFYPEGTLPNLNLGNGYSSNTLEPEFFEVNGLITLQNVINSSQKTKEDMIRFMENDKTAWSMAVFESEKCFKYPRYIEEAVKKCQELLQH